MLKEVNAIVTNDKRVWILSNDPALEVVGATIVNADVFSQLRSFVMLFGPGYGALKASPDFDTSFRPVALQMLAALMPTANPVDIENCFTIFENSTL